MTVISYPKELPIVQRREEILKALRSHAVVIIAGETGSGKTTQLPKMCLEAGLAEHGRIGCTQPRRVAAMSISKRVAEELGVVWGREVGCKMRFNDDTSRETRIKFMTDGILLAEIQADPALRAYSTLILDEAHERSLNVDFLLGYLQGLLKRRNDLKLVITSATIDTGAFSQAFGGAPVIEVSGRLFPVDIRYRPVAEGVAGEMEVAKIERGRGEMTGVVESAVRAVEDVLIETELGDLLVFMPTERDIRETRELLEGRLGSGIEVLGLFGRLSGVEQQRIFSPGDRRRVIVATNIAETSLTIPRIGTVIDSGLVRMSRYNARTRTKRLPVEEISQSSANQRSGRAGRLSNGVCIRLYSEEDHEKRPRFTQPEIQRANLAEVILRMKAFKLGEVESFPFLNPPQAQSIRAGYQLLQELGALSETHELTVLGRELARLPIDPTLGRMLVQARSEGVLAEMLIIAAGLSIADPRERPEEEKEAAAAAHRVFADPESDFLTLLNLWRAAFAREEGSGAFRRFCKANFLSHARMREWRDVHKQLEQTVDERVGVEGRGESKVSQNSVGQGRANLPGRGRSQRPPNGVVAAGIKAAGGGREEVPYDGIHRAVLSGLLGQIGQRAERNIYKSSSDRLISVFPGSSLYERQAKKVKSVNAGEVGSKGGATRQPQWLVAGEIVQTSQLFARTVARVEPHWVVELGAHLCNYRYINPQWSGKAGRVLVWERILIYGLELSRRQVDYGKIDAIEATELFIRGALVAGEAQITGRFFAENRSLRERIESALTKVRSNRVQDIDEAFYRFYAARIENVSSVHDLNRLLKEARDPDFLCATETELMGDGGLDYDRRLFPDQVSIGNAVIPLNYAYNPGADGDGVTMRVPLPLVERLTSAEMHWLVPGLREEQIGTLLRALPKSVRKLLNPLEAKVREVVNELKVVDGDMLKALSEFLSRKYGVSVRAEDWKSLPDYLRPRVEVIDRDNRTVAVGRDLECVKASIEKSGLRSDAWERAERQFEQRGLRHWSVGDLPQSIVIEEVGGVPLLGYPGLMVRQGDHREVDLRLFRKQAAAQQASMDGVRRLAEIVLAKEVTWLGKEFRALGRDLLGLGGQPAKPVMAIRGGFSEALGGLSKKPPAGGESEFGSVAHFGEQLPESGVQHIIAHAFGLDPIYPLEEKRFELMLEKLRRELPAMMYQIGEWTRQIVAARQKTLGFPKRYTGMEADVQRLVPADFLANTPHGQLVHVLRYLRAIQVRAERADVSPSKDREKAQQLKPFENWRERVPKEMQDDFRWKLEELRVSVFAQELGTAQTVSMQRLKGMCGL